MAETIMQENLQGFWYFYSMEWKSGNKQCWKSHGINLSTGNKTPFYGNNLQTKLQLPFSKRKLKALSPASNTIKIKDDVQMLP